MNRIHTTVAITIMCAGIVGWQVINGTGKPVDSKVQPSLTSAPSTPLAETSESAQITQPDHPISSSRLPSGLPSQETELVMGFRVRKDRNCDVEIRYLTDSETGEVSEVMHCEPRNPELPHPYESWSNELLAQEAYADAKAAEVLALRHIASEQEGDELIGLNLLYRSVALSGDPEVFRKAIGARYAIVEENGKPKINHLKQLLVFSHIGETLGSSVFESDMIVRTLKKHEVPASDIASLKAMSAQILNKMAELQTEITGSTSIKEALTNG